jgi:hypothetical protein
VSGLLGFDCSVSQCFSTVWIYTIVKLSTEVLAIQLVEVTLMDREILTLENAILTIKNATILNDINRLMADSVSMNTIILSPTPAFVLSLYTSSDCLTISKPISLTLLLR